MLVFSSNGKISIPDERIIYAFSEHAPGRYCPATLIMDDGSEITGLVLKEALTRLITKLDDSKPLPPMAA
jgi:hypothetical protein